MATQVLQGKVTYIGLIVTLIATIVQLFGGEITGEDQVALTNAITIIVQFAGLGIAYFGRWRAKRREDENICKPDTNSTNPSA